MKPAQTAENYDRLASWWRQRHADSTYGVKQLKNAIGFCKNKELALDVGCGSSGRFIRVLKDHGFAVEGLDASPEMIRQARKTQPDCSYYTGEISTRTFPKQYDLISAWDSTFHLPLERQEPALANMCHGLKQNGIIIFTLGGNDTPGEISGSFQGEDFEYSTLGIARFVRLLSQLDCAMRHLEFDQGPAEPHVYIIAEKK